MNKNILKIGSSGRIYSYKDIYSYRNREILESVNKGIDSGDNVVYCMCNGKTEKKFIKMHTRKNEKGVYYSLMNNSKSSLKHKPDCPKYDELKFKKELILKGRVYNNLNNIIDLPIYSNSNKSNSNKVTEKYTPIYGLGEMILTVANNEYIDKKLKIGKEDDVLSYLYRYYEPVNNQGISTYLNDVVVSPTLDLKLGQIIFNPKWIKCDEIDDKTSNVVKSYIHINKRYKNNSYKVLQYVLLKYLGYQLEGNNVKIELYIKCKNRKENFNKKIFIYMNKFDFFKRFSMDKVEDGTLKADYYVSALVDAVDGVLFVKDIAFIPVYPGYCIPVDTVNEIKLLSELLVFRNKLTIKKIAKMTEVLEYDNVVPDLIVSIKGEDKPIFIEFFDWILPEYYTETLAKTLKYEQLSNEGKCKFLGFYNNLGWNCPSTDIILYNNFNTMDNVGKKVKSYISKLMNNDWT